jgi:hypothetical protein
MSLIILITYTSQNQLKVYGKNQMKVYGQNQMKVYGPKLGENNSV